MGDAIGPRRVPPSRIRDFLRVYLIVDPESAGTRERLPDIVRAGVAGGATIVQLRDKHGTDDEVLACARELKKVLDHLRVPLIINDRVEVARAVEADGVHVGPYDLPPSDVRTMMGAHAIIGFSVPDEGTAAGVDPAVVDYVGIGPFFATATKANAAPAMGPESFARMCRCMTLPIVGIGGINAQNARAVIEAGADGVSFVSAVCAASDPEAATREIAAIVAEAVRATGAE